MFFDEIDKYVELALDFGDQRTNTFPWTSKQLYYSTPEEYGKPITQLITKEAEVLYLHHACCPICGHEQRMLFENIRWFPYHIPEEWPDGDFKPMAEDEMERFSVVALQAPSWISHFISLSKAAGAFLRGLNSREKHRVFVTQHETVPWKIQVKAKKEDEILKARVSKLLKQTVPDAAVALTCGVDIQKAGFWYGVRAWSVEYTSWLIDYNYITSWAEVEDLLYNKRYPFLSDSKKRIGIFRAGFDIGGGKYNENMSSTEEVYMWIIKHRGRPGPRLWATKGSSRSMTTRISIGKPLEKTRSGRSIPGGIQIVSLNTSELKENYHYRLEKAIENNSHVRAAYLHKDVGKNYAAQIMAEVLETNPKTGIDEWVQKHRDNHMLDVEVINSALASPEWPGGGVHLIAPPPVEEQPSGPKITVSGNDFSGRVNYNRPSWLNR
jgi:phage terminase large subunit GpA-like protein